MGDMTEPNTGTPGDPDVTIADEVRHRAANAPRAVAGPSLGGGGGKGASAGDPVVFVGSSGATGTWGAPNLPSGRDDFRARQQPDPRPVDDLSRFVLDRIQFTENGPRHEVPQVYNQPAGPMAHRYAAEMRADMVAFRRIVAAYCMAWDARPASGPGPLLLGLCTAMKAIAMRFAEHPDFDERWRLE